MTLLRILTQVKRMLQEQSKNSNKDSENINGIPNRNPEDMELRNMVTQPKNSLQEFNRRPAQAEERTNELKDRALEIIQSERQKGEQKGKRNINRIMGSSWPVHL